MTPLERREPAVIDGVRRSRIANGSGTQPGEVNRAGQAVPGDQKMMKRMGNIPGLGTQDEEGQRQGQSRRASHAERHQAGGLEAVRHQATPVHASPASATTASRD